MRFSAFGIPVALALLVAAALPPDGSEALAKAGSKSIGTWPAVAKRMRAAALAQAKADYELALARAYTEASAEAQDAAREEARGEYADARDTVKAQYAARLDLAGLLQEEAPYSVAINPADFVSGVTNPYNPLTPGTTLVYETQTADGLERNEVETTSSTKVILGVTCIEVHDQVWLDDVLIEDTLDWFAQDATGNVWYFGEESKQFTDGRLVGIEGSWQSGVDNAQPGIIMKAAPAIDDAYRQEFLLGVAEDYGRVESLAATASVPAGEYSTCVKTFDGSALEPDAREHKTYASGVGVVLEEDDETGDRTELVEVRTGP